MSTLFACCKNKFLGICLVTACFWCPNLIYSQTEIPDEVLDIFDNKCAFVGCHAGTTSPKGLDLTEDFALSSLVNQASVDVASYMRVKPQDPVRSYLIMKLKGTSGIEGDKMPKGSDALSQSEIGAIESWINSLPAELKVEAPEREYAEAFPGLSLATLTTTQTLEKGTFSYRIAHRWNGKVSDGFDDFFGLDGGAIMFTQLAFSVSNDLMVSIARTRVDATFEFVGKWRFLREKTDGSMPISAAIRAGFDWATRKNIVGVPESRTNSQRFALFAQAPISKQISDRISVLLVPGILINGNVRVEDPDPLVTLGFAAKFMMVKDFSVFVEGVPIIAGSETSGTIGGPLGPLPSGRNAINDAFTIGLERKIGGHVFHVYVTNSLGLATNHYMSGGDLDFTKGDFRLGFNIYRILRFPF